MGFVCLGALVGMVRREIGMDEVVATGMAGGSHGHSRFTGSLQG